MKKKILYSFGIILITIFILIGAKVIAENIEIQDSEFTGLTKCKNDYITEFVTNKTREEFLKITWDSIKSYYYMASSNENGATAVTTKRVVCINQNASDGGTLRMKPMAVIDIEGGRIKAEGTMVKDSNWKYVGDKAAAIARAAEYEGKHADSWVEAFVNYDNKYYRWVDLFDKLKENGVFNDKYTNAFKTQHNYYDQNSSYREALFPPNGNVTGYYDIYVTGDGVGTGENSNISINYNSSSNKTTIGYYTLNNVQLSESNVTKKVTIKFEDGTSTTSGTLKYNSSNKKYYIEISGKITKNIESIKFKQSYKGYKAKIIVMWTDYFQNRLIMDGKSASIENEVNLKIPQKNTDVSLQKYIIGTIEGNGNSNITDTNNTGNNVIKEPDIDYSKDEEIIEDEEDSEEIIEFDNYLMLGDSRTVGMYQSLGGKSTNDVIDNTLVYRGKNIKFLAKSASGYEDWFNNTTNKEKIENTLKDLNESNKKSKCIIWLGVNDCWKVNADKYASTVKVLANKYKNVEFVYYSVGYVGPQYTYVTNYNKDYIDEFNNDLKNQISSLKLENFHFADFNNKLIIYGNNIIQLRKVGNLIKSDENITDSMGLHYNTNFNKALWEQVFSEGLTKVITKVQNNSTNTTNTNSNNSSTNNNSTSNATENDNITYTPTGRENRYAVDANDKLYNTSNASYNHYNKEISNHTNRKSVSTDFYKINKPVEIEAGDSVVYKIEVYNNKNVKSLVTVSDDFSSLGKPEIVEIRTSTAEDYSKATKIDDLTKKEYNESNTSYDGVRYWYDEANKNNKFRFNLDAGATRYIYVIIKYNEYTGQVMRNRAWIPTTSPANNSNYRTIDADYVKMKDYKVSLEKFVTKVTDSNGTNVENYNQTSGTYENRSGKRYNTNATTNLDTNKNTYKPNNIVEVETGDIVTYTIRLKNEGTTKVSIGQIYDSFTSYKNGTIKLTQTGEITGNGGGTYERDTYETTDNTYDIHLITFSNPTLLEPGKYVDVTIKFKVEITKEATASSHTLINTAAIMTSSLKNKNDIIVPDGDGTDNNRDSDYVKTKTYAVSLEKYISAVNGKTIINKNYDFNGDGVVDTKDVDLLQRYSVDFNNIIKEKIEKYGDINNDGIIGIDDVTALQKLINTCIREGRAEHKYDDDTSTNSDWKYNNVVTVSNGDKVTYTIKVTNDSTDTSVYISEITDYLPDGVYYNSITYKGNQYNTTTDNAVKLDRTAAKLLAPGESTSFTITVTVIEPNISLNILKNTAEITQMKNRNTIEVQDTTPNNNKDSDYIQLNYPDEPDEPDDDSAVISGLVWNDKALDKMANNYNGKYDSDVENGVKDVKVYLYRYGVNDAIASKQTDEKGYYCFRDKDINFFNGKYKEVVTDSWKRYIKAPKNSTNNRWNDSKEYYSYYIVFEYDGITYTSTPDGTTCVSVTDSTAYNNEAYKTNSNAKEDNATGKQGLITRQSFNNRFSPINNQSGISYTTTNEAGYIPQSNHKYNSKTMAMQSSTNLIRLSNSATLEKQIKYVNLGLRGKDIFDLELTSDVYSTKVSVNGQSGEYNYNSNQVTVRKSDISVAEDTANFASEAREGSIGKVEQSIRKTDLDVNEVNKRVFGANPYTGTRLGIEVTYKITVTNASQTDGTATKIANYYDSRYTFVKAYSSENEQLNTEAGDSGSGFNSVIITTPGTNLTQSQTMDIYVVYKLNQPITTLSDLVEGKTDKIPTYNMTEIYEYTTKCGRGQTEYTRGVIDKDSAPGSANKEQVRTNNKEGIPTTTVQYYFGKISNSSVDLTKLKYEDDTYATPTLYFTSSDNNRTIEGTVFEDKTKYYGDRIKSGNGIIDENENKVGKVRVRLLEEATDNNYNINYNGKYYKIRFETETDENGKYTFEGFLPGNYIIYYEYGNINTFLYGNGVNSNRKSYNGEDFQSTNNTGKIENKTNKEIARLNSTPNYWYVYNEKEGVSTGTDNISRREYVSKKVAKYNDYQMTVLNNAKSGKSKDECTVKDDNGVDITADHIAKDTWMEAYTPEMNLTVEETVVENDETKQKNRFDEYLISNMNFGIAELPVTIIDLQKHVSSFKITDSAGDNTIASLAKQEDGTWKTIGDVYPIEKEGRKGYDVSIEEVKLQGAKLEVTFDITAEMKVEKDFRNGEGIIATITALTDFIDNDLSYNEGLGDNSKYWKVGKFETSTASTVEGADQYATIVTATGDNAILKLKKDEIATARITLEKVLSSSDVTIGDIIASSIDTYEYNNTIEIMGIDYTNTKTEIGNTEIELKDRIRTPGTNDPTTNNMIIIAGKQHDSATSETIAIHPPAGEDNSIVYYIVAVISLAVLATGIVLIKKYAIKKDQK